MNVAEPCLCYKLILWRISELFIEFILFTTKRSNNVAKKEKYSTSILNQQTGLCLVKNDDSINILLIENALQKQINKK